VSAGPAWAGRIWNQGQVAQRPRSSAQAIRARTTPSSSRLTRHAEHVPWPILHHGLPIPRLELGIVSRQRTHAPSAQASPLLEQSSPLVWGWGFGVCSAPGIEGRWRRAQRTVPPRRPQPPLGNHRRVKKAPDTPEGMAALTAQGTAAPPPTALRFPEIHHLGRTVVVGDHHPVRCWPHSRSSSLRSKPITGRHGPTAAAGHQVAAALDQPQAGGDVKTPAIEGHQFSPQTVPPPVGAGAPGEQAITQQTFTQTGRLVLRVVVEVVELVGDPGRCRSRIASRYGPAAPKAIAKRCLAPGEPQAGLSAMPSFCDPLAGKHQGKWSWRQPLKRWRLGAADRPDPAGAAGRPPSSNPAPRSHWLAIRWPGGDPGHPARPHRALQGDGAAECVAVGGPGLLAPDSAGIPRVVAHPLEDPLVGPGAAAASRSGGAVPGVLQRASSTGRHLAHGELVRPPAHSSNRLEAHRRGRVWPSTRGWRSCPGIAGSGTRRGAIGVHSGNPAGPSSSARAGFERPQRGASPERTQVLRSSQVNQRLSWVSADATRTAASLPQRSNAGPWIRGNRKSHCRPPFRSKPPPVCPKGRWMRGGRAKRSSRAAVARQDQIEDPEAASPHGPEGAPPRTVARLGECLPGTQRTRRAAMPVPALRIQASLVSTDAELGHCSGLRLGRALPASHQRHPALH